MLLNLYIGYYNDGSILKNIEDLIMDTDLNIKPQILIVTGYSGAGKSTALKALEDLDFFCIDNLPIGFLTSFFHFITKSPIDMKKIALGIDIRGGHNIADLVKELLKWNKNSLFSIKIIFLVANLQTLVKRYQETRRKHPLIGNIDLSQAINYEKNLLQPLADISDIVLETDRMNIHDLRFLVRNFFAQLKQCMVVSLSSFGFKYGVPQDVNFVYDLRSLPNPYFVPELKSYDGTSSLIRDYLFAKPEVQEYWQKLHDFCVYAIKKAYGEGRFFIHIALGCTGGRHRSVAFVQELALIQLDNIYFLVKHRDIYKDIN